MLAVAVLSLVILLLEQLPYGRSPLRFSRAGFLVGGAMAMFGMALLAGAGRVAGRLLLAPG